MGLISVKSVAITKTPFDMTEKTIILDLEVPLTSMNKVLNQELKLIYRNGQWLAEISIDQIPLQDTPEAACERLSLWLQALSKGVKGKNIKHLRLGGLFKEKRFK
ncbi:hypothetical protein [Photobacterium kishitanii]|uniref:Uncharacterized protein n=1 Tax=Photobacterium kishitanii TaxID=318456 RepID=A0A2T3KM19_9GAMM|nr:hypothetical protein [Photobacterium kishitanii]PSV00717.1 hypothetical protein C9J27_06130 [Photobacterium kishitanii]